MKLNLDIVSFALGGAVGIIMVVCYVSIKRIVMRLVTFKLEGRVISVAKAQVLAEQGWVSYVKCSS
jgi:hypothetical protein